MQLLRFDSDLVEGIRKLLMEHTSPHKKIAAAIRNHLEVLHEVLTYPNGPDFDNKTSQERLHFTKRLISGTVISSNRFCFMVEVL